MAGIDGRVTGLNRDVFQAMQKVKNPQKMTGAEAKDVRAAINKDGKLDASEKDLLLEITQDSNKTISIEASKTADFNPSNLEFSAAKADALGVFETITKPVNLAKLFKGGSEDFEKLIDIATNVPGGKKAVEGAVVRELATSWSSSNFSNRYAPIRTTLGETFDKVKNADPEVRDQAQNMLHDAMKRIDDHYGGSIPDFIYNWLRPGGHI